MPSITNRTVEVAYSGGGISGEVIVGGGGSDVGGGGAPVVGGVGGGDKGMQRSEAVPTMVANRTVEVSYSGGGVSGEIVVGGGGSDVVGGGAPVVGGVGGGDKGMQRSEGVPTMVANALGDDGDGRR
nr:glycine-rich cell wall structural protein 1-like [Aegilops tauschii subsp. strangulata]